MILVRPTEPEDIQSLAPRLRQEDLRELEALNGCSAQKALSEGLRDSDECWSITFNDLVIGMFGVAPLEGRPDAGAIWLLASDDLPKIRWEFLKKTRPWVGYFLSKYPKLTNMVDSRNTQHVKWIKWAGFNFINEYEVGPEKVRFLEFFKQRDPNACAMPLPFLSSH